MFVFPAFNDSYSKRKRTYKCCAKCRSRRVRCIITLADYDVTGCENCKEIGAVCDLTNKPKLRPRAGGRPRAARRSYRSPPLPPRPASAGENDASNASTGSNQRPSASTTPKSLTPAQPQMPPVFAHPYAAYEAPGPFAQPFFAHHPPDQEPFQYQAGKRLARYELRPEDSLRLAPIAQLKNDDAPQGLPRPDLWLLQAGAARMALSPTSKGVFSPFPMGQFPPPALAAELDPGFDVRVVTAAYLKDRFGFVMRTTQVKHYEVVLPPKFNEKHKFYADILSDDEDASHAHGFHLRSKHVLEMLVRIHAFTLSNPGEFDVSEADTRRLVEIYFFKLNSLFPIVDEGDFWRRYEAHSVTSITIYAIVLAISRDALCEPILGQCFAKKSVPYRESLDDFMTSLEFKIRQLLLIQSDFGCEDKLERVIVYTLLSYHFGSHRMGNEQSSQDLFCAVSNAFGLSIHMNFVHERLLADNLKEKSDYFKKLWWTLYLFDRFNAVMNSKAFVVKDSDFNIGVPEDDDDFKELIHQVQNLQALIFFVFQPTRAKFTPPSAEELHNSGRLILEPLPDHLTAFKHKNFSELTTKEYKRIQYHVLTRIVQGFYMIIYMAGIAKVDGTHYEVKENMLKLCHSYKSLFDSLQQSNAEDIGQKLLANIPFVPCFFSIIYAILIRYETKVIVLRRINKKTSDLSDEIMQQVDDLFQSTTLFLLDTFSKWWFLNKILSSTQHLLTKIKTTKRRGKRSRPGNKLRKTKTSSSALIPDGLIVPGFATISSHKFTTESTLRNSLRATRGIEPKDLEEVDMMGSEDEEEGEDQENEMAKEELTDDHLDFDKFNQAETNKWIETLSDDLFTVQNLSDYFSKDPIFQDFFSGKLAP